ncbi:MAG TPA: HEAT repeat domain-containing protein [Candidatus Acidoferrales bacterium]|nr:HEAT repeat domain-containing protein [Candidatus Acidoferrales bacterium]
MQQDSLPTSGAQACPEFETQLILYAIDELEGAERNSFEEHLDHCHPCMMALEAERRMLAALTPHQRPEPSAALLASCRNRLEDTLDEMDHRSIFARWAEAIFPAHWLALHPAASAAALILIGFSVGMYAPRHFQGVSPASGTPRVATLNSMGLDSQELQNSNVSGISWVPAEGNLPPRIEVQITTQKPMVVQGTVDDKEVKQVLLYVLRNGRRFGPDVRINAVDLLKARASDAEVEQALCQVERVDNNPAVRLKALEALTDAPPNPASIQTMLDAVVKDANIGVRVEAVNSLRTLSERGALKSDPEAIKVLRDLSQGDSNVYIRLQSAAAIQQATPGQN